MITVEALGKTYTIDPDKDHILKRGVAVPYEHSKKEDKVVLVPYVYWSKHIQKVIIVPVWSMTDGASSPLRTVFPKFGKSEYPAFAHDILYTLYGIRNYLKEKFSLTRKDCDIIFRDFCILVGFSSIRANIAYTAVRVGGSKAYKSQTPMFIPYEFRTFYIDNYPEITLDKQDGEFTVP